MSVKPLFSVSQDIIRKVEKGMAAERAADVSSNWSTEEIETLRQLVCCR